MCTVCHREVFFTYDEGTGGEEKRKFTNPKVIFTVNNRQQWQFGREVVHLFFFVKSGGFSVSRVSLETAVYLENNKITHNARHVYC